MDFMEHWERMIQEQELERDRLRVHQITVQVDDKKKANITSARKIRSSNTVWWNGIYTMKICLADTSFILPIGKLLSSRTG